MPTMSLTLAYGLGSGGQQNTVSATYGAEAQISEDIPASQTNLAVAVAFAIAKVKAVYLCSDVAMTVKTNSSTVPDDTFSLSAGVPVAWITGQPASLFPFTADVTGLYITNTDAGVLTLAVLVDPT